ncbi:hypothetical protein VTK73DRAFT_761 [Phialemonium thermophilum]|uniref:non-specific serine/threonine protein kinase n=1 Tax=Phialemonium thermophilum TaxID=223376 RepID=A0ABR3XCW2_9PEZI
MAATPETDPSNQQGSGQDEAAEQTMRAPSAADKPRDDQPPSQAPPGSQPQLSVRFKSAVEEITPDVSAQSSAEDQKPNERLGNAGQLTPEQLRALSSSLKDCRLQEKRMNIFSYEPFSLPASRTASNEDDSGQPSRQGTQSSASHQSPLLSPRGSDANTPPLTPAASGPGDSDEKRREPHDQERRGRLANVVSPREAPQDQAGSGRTSGGKQSSDQAQRRAASTEGRASGLVGNHRKGLFSVGPGGNSPTGSVPVSRESSPSSVAGPQYYARPFTPAGDANDPYAADKRQPQNKIEQRFVFSRKKKQSSPSSSYTSLARPNHEKRHSGFFGHSNRKDELAPQESTASSRPGSMADLKRYFKLGGHHKHKRGTSPTPSTRSGVRTPVGSRSTLQIPFGDDHGLSSKYGKLGRVLGSGAGGSVRLMKRAEDGVVFAVKEFRPRHSYETEREYIKKLTAEYCIGSSLHHGNIIETLDIVQEKGKWYEVMEYAPYDLFAIVMTGRMSREEIACCFLQILSGVTYLHSMGLAHRDLKLDNVVVNEHGIMKIIDFGSAHVFRYPFENGIVLASGIVGSDPYLAPEVYDERKYDPQGVDIWSLAIIFCCMTLRRFPWKVPRLTDSSFKLFAAEPTPGHDPKKLILPPSRSTGALGELPDRDVDFHQFKDGDGKLDADEDKEKSQHSTSGQQQGEKKEVIRGPWRILRLLPRESRHVIGRMLEIDPKKRAKMDEILEDNWVSTTVICRQIEPGIVINADDHTHVLEPPTPSSNSNNNNNNNKY